MRFGPSQTHYPLVVEDYPEVLSRPMPDRALMVDIETLDTETTAAILSIGATTFNPRGDGLNNEDEFVVTIDRQSNEAHGRTVSEATLAWWQNQSVEAQASVFQGPFTELSIALREFTTWINILQPTPTRIWANDPDFDVNILAHACRSLGIIWPFKFWETRSCRTAKEMAYPEGDFPQLLATGARHNAIVDARVQALEIQHAFYVLGC